MRQHGSADFEVHSAGTEPKGLNARTMRLLDEVGIDGSFARSKSVDEFAGQSFDYVITVCDQARQVCPVFPGGGQSLHWGYPDPAEATGTEDEVMAVYRHTFTAIGENGSACSSRSRCGTATRRRPRPSAEALRVYGDPAPLPPPCPRGRRRRLERPGRDSARSRTKVSGRPTGWVATSPKSDWRRTR